MVLRKSFYIRWSAGRSPRVHEVNLGRDPSICHFCSQNIENIDHVFKNCPFVQGIWDLIKYNYPTPLFYEGDFLY